MPEREEVVGPSPRTPMMGHAVQSADVQIVARAQLAARRPPPLRAIGHRADLIHCEIENASSRYKQAVLVTSRLSRERSRGRARSGGRLRDAWTVMRALTGRAPALLPSGESISAPLD